MSGGERGRVLLSKLMLMGANLLVLDEPTNDLDLVTLRALEEALAAFAGASVVVRHDRWFLDRVATHILHLDGQGGAYLHTGDVSSLLERLAREKEAAEAKQAAKKPAAPKPQAAPAPAASNAKPLAPWEQRELQDLEQSVAAQEAAVAKLDARLADPELYKGGPEAARKLEAERKPLAAKLATDMARWEELAERA